jgi:hypothetical protein
MESFCVFLVQHMQIHSPRSWIVSLRNADNSAESTFTIVDPLSPQDRLELLWYFEQYVLEDAFSHQRAQAAVQCLEACGRSLWTSIKPHVNKVLPSQVTTTNSRQVHLKIVADGSSTSLHSLPWERLENGYSNVQKILHVDLAVSRGILDISTPENYWKLHGKCLNILFVSARPGGKADVSYRVVSSDVWTLLSTNSQLKTQAKMFFSRPGTWARFLKVLASRGDGFFDIVHFDTHGLIKQKRGQDLYVASLPTKLV